MGIGDWGLGIGIGDWKQFSNFLNISSLSGLSPRINVDPYKFKSNLNWTKLWNIIIFHIV